MASVFEHVTSRSRATRFYHFLATKKTVSKKSIVFAFSYCGVFFSFRRRLGYFYRTRQIAKLGKLVNYLCFDVCIQEYSTINNEALHQILFSSPSGAKHLRYWVIQGATVWWLEWLLAEQEDLGSIPVFLKCFSLLKY